MHSKVNQEEASTTSLDPLLNDYNRNKWKYSMAMFISGLINNSGYVLVGTAAQSIAHHFGMDNFMSAFNFTLIFLSIGMVFLNARCFLKIQHKTRIYISFLLSLISFLIIGACTTFDQKWAFYLALVGSTICGCMQSFGEATMLGYSKSFPPQLIGFWSSGTGCAGPFGAGYYLALKAMKLPELYIFLLLIPFLGLYFLSFRWLESRRSQLKTEIENLQPQVDEKYTSQVMEDESVNNMKMNFANIKFAWKRAWPYSLNLGLVYFLEYSCLTCWADRAHRLTDDNDQSFFKKNAFVVLSFSYQIGVFISRSSLEVIKIKKVWILTIIQAFNFLLWLYIALNTKVNIELQIPLMVWVGLMGGTSYVNVVYLIVSGEFLPHEYKELAMNVNSMTNNTGIVLATLLAMGVDNFWLTD